MKVNDEMLVVVHREGKAQLVQPSIFATCCREE